MSARAISNHAAVVAIGCPQIMWYTYIYMGNLTRRKGKRSHKRARTVRGRRDRGAKLTRRATSRRKRARRDKNKSRRGRRYKKAYTKRRRLAKLGRRTRRRRAIPGGGRNPPLAQTAYVLSSTNAAGSKVKHAVGQSKWAGVAAELDEGSASSGRGASHSAAVAKGIAESDSKSSKLPMDWASNKGAAIHGSVAVSEALGENLGMLAAGHILKKAVIAGYKKFRARKKVGASDDEAGDGEAAGSGEAAGTDGGLESLEGAIAAGDSAAAATGEAATATAAEVGSASLEGSIAAGNLSAGEIAGEIAESGAEDTS